MNRDTNTIGVAYRAEFGGPLTAKQLRITFTADVNIGPGIPAFNSNGQLPTSCVQLNSRQILLTYVGDQAEDQIIDLGTIANISFGPNVQADTIQLITTEAE